MINLINNYLRHRRQRRIESIAAKRHSNHEGQGAKRWGVYIKSHCAAPDYEDYTRADTKEEAITKFLWNSALCEFDRSMLENLIEEVLDE